MEKQTKTEKIHAIQKMLPFVVGWLPKDKEKQIKVAEQHANAAKAHADGVQWQTKISALKEARELGVSAESLHPYMVMQTLHALFNKNSDENTEDEVEVVDIMKSGVTNKTGNQIASKKKWLHLPSCSIVKG